MFSTTRTLAILALSTVIMIYGEHSRAESTTYTIHKLAGIETGLVKLAHIDDTIAAGERDNVWIYYESHAMPASAQGRLFNCSGVFNRKNCDVYGTTIHEVPGTYDYTVTYTASGIGGGSVALSGRFVVEEPTDFVIVSVGDSVASGEGNPQKPLQDLAVGWNDVPSNYHIPYTNYDGTETEVAGCHRSSFAGPVLAAKRIAQTNAVSFFHVPCTGAKLSDVQTGDVLLNGNPHPSFQYLSNNKLNTQLHWAHQTLERIDVLLVSGGANNAEAGPGESGFGAIVGKCLTPFNCSNDAVFESNLKDSIDALAGTNGYYARFADLIEHGTRGITPTPDQIPGVVAITEYFDPTRNENGEFPNWIESGGCAGVVLGIPLMLPEEWEFLYYHMVVPLNEKVHWAAQQFGWTAVGGIADEFRTHGYCSSGGLGDVIGDSWVIKVPESITTQGDQNGTSHPDKTGHQVYGERIYNAVLRANPPRSWAMAWADNIPYVFGTWVNSDVEVTLQSYNPIRESGVAATFYGLGAPGCSSGTAGTCEQYSMPFVVSESGRNVLSFYSTNNYQAPETRVDPVEILIDKDPPVMTCSANPAQLWAPNRQFSTVTASVTAVDEVSGPADYWLSEIKDSYGQAETAVIEFELDTADVEGKMLAGRRGNQGARHYTLTYSSIDHLGNLGTCDVIVTVPHDQREHGQVLNSSKGPDTFSGYTLGNGGQSAFSGMFQQNG